jgi:beta-lactam-binding protein with PASTA domain
MKKKSATREENLKYFGTIGRVAAIFFLGFSLLLLVSTIILIIRTKPDREVVVPDVEGKRFVEVYNSLVRKGIKPEIKFKDINDLDDGMVLSQRPKSGKVVPENSSIKLVVTRSSYSLEVPNLVGKELPLALNNLRNIHRHDKTLSLGTGVISYIPSDTVTDNIVIEQLPRAGETVSLNRKVNILVSSGKVAPDTVMPGVTGQSIELCFDLLRAKGLSVAEEIVAVDKPEESGIILSQTPEKGSPVATGGACTVKVGYYPLEKHIYAAYEKVEFQIPADEKAGTYEASVEDGHSKRIRFSRSAGPGQKMVFVFRREGNATITFLRNKIKIDDMDIDVD